MILGIDPGKTGALVWIDGGKVAQFSRMPEGPAATAYAISLYAKQTKFAVIEDVGAMTYVDKNGMKRGQGASASFNFGFGAGMLHGILAAFNIRTWPVSPSTWKASLGLTSDKYLSLSLAAKTFPESSHLFKMRKDDGLAEAALLALFGAKHFK